MGLAPMMKVHERVLGIPFRKIQFISMMREAAHPSNVAGQLDIIGAAGDEESIDAIFSYLSEQEHNWDYMEFHPVPEDSTTLRWFESEGRTHTISHLSRRVFETHILQVQGTWTEYLAANKHHLHKVKRQAEKPQSCVYGLHVSQFGAVGEIPGGFETLLDIERRSWKWESGISLNSTFYRGFYRQLAENLSGSGMLKLYLLVFNGNPIAYTYLVQFANVLWGLKMSHDEAHRTRGPGTYLMYHVLRDIHEQGLSALDMLWGEEQYKVSTMNSRKQYRELFVFNDSMRGKLSAAYFRAHLLHRSFRRAQDISRRLARKMGIRSSSSELTREDQVGKESGDGNWRKNNDRVLGQP